MKPYYDLDGITIYHGDCREIVPTLGKFDLLLTDPPYGVNLGKRINNNRARDEYQNYNDDAAHTIDMINACWPLFRLASNRIVLTPGVRLMFEYEKPDHAGAFFHPAGAGCNKWGFSCWQPIYFYGKDPFAGAGSRPDSFESTEPAEKLGHPCAKPIGMWTWLLNRVSLPSETILDPFAGSGTTGRAAKDLGRKCTMIEREERYCEIAARRMSQGVLITT